MKDSICLIRDFLLSGLIRDFLLSDRDLLDQEMAMINLVDGQVLFAQGDTGNDLYLIESGQIQLNTYNQAGQEITLNTISAGELFGEMALVDDQLRVVSAVSLGSSRLLRLKRNTCWQRLHNSPELSQLMLQLLNQRIRHLIEYIEKLTEWTQLLIDGQYSQVIRTIEEIEVDSQGNRAWEAAAKFFKQIIQTMQKPEENQHQEVEKLKLEVDQEKLQQQVEEIVSTEYFEYLNKLASKLRTVGNTDNVRESRGKVIPLRKSVAHLNSKNNWSLNSKIKQALSQGLKKRSEILNSLIMKAWENEEFRQKLIANPREVYAVKFGCEIPEGLAIDVIEETLDHVKIVLPRNPALEITEQELSEESLDAVSGGCWLGMTDTINKSGAFFRKP
ncbi:MAG: NHLP leader peptide family natural product precursor [Symploca sp. SIO3C6]|nr:NHLP leader peptide family natural product precursor [Symploca sp. SIO3C6]NET04092.1 NHLP leader peptide family natural product precursor [Symploca sp. SIO2B6]